MKRFKKKRKWFPMKKESKSVKKDANFAGKVKYPDKRPFFVRIQRTRRGGERRFPFLKKTAQDRGFEGGRGGSRKQISGNL